MKTWELPVSWHWTDIGGIAADVPNAVVDGPFGSNLKVKDYVPDGVPVLQGKNITKDIFQWREVRYVSEEKANDLARSTVKVGDFLIVKIGSIGYSAQITDLNGFDRALIPANLVKITPSLDKIDENFLRFWLRSIDVKRHLIGVASKTAQPALSLGKIKKLPVPLPPIEEQRRIAAILDKADAIRRKREQGLTLADDFLRSAFLDMFGDPRISPKAFPTPPLEEQADILVGNPFPSAQYGKEGIRVCRGANVLPQRLDWDDVRFWSADDINRFKRFLLAEGDVILALDRPWISTGLKVARVTSASKCSPR